MSGMLNIEGKKCWLAWKLFFFFFNMDIRVNLRASQLILHALKLIII